MAALLTDLGLVCTNLITTIGSVATAIVAQPLLLIPLGIGLLGAGVGLVKRFV